MTTPRESATSVVKQLFLGADVGVELDENHLRYLSEWLPDVTGIVTEGQRGVASHDGGAEQKSADARDFEDENELAEDLAAPTPSPIDSWTKYARPDGWKYGQAVQSLQGGEYDYDTPTPANPVSVAVSQGPSLRAPQGHQQTGTVGSTAVSTPAPTASLSRHISAQRAPGGAILKFTDLFDTVPQRIAFPKASAARIADGEEAGAAVEDEQDEFAVFSSLNAGPAATDGNASNVGKLPHLSQLQARLKKKTRTNSAAPLTTRTEGSMDLTLRDTTSTIRARRDMAETDEEFEFSKRPTLVSGTCLVDEDDEVDTNASPVEGTEHLLSAVSSRLQPVQFFPWEVDIMWEIPPAALPNSSASQPWASHRLEDAGREQQYQQQQPEDEEEELAVPSRTSWRNSHPMDALDSVTLPASVDFRLTSGSPKVGLAAQTKDVATGSSDGDKMDVDVTEPVANGVETPSSSGAAASLVSTWSGSVMPLPSDLVQASPVEPTPQHALVSRFLNMQLLLGPANAMVEQAVENDSPTTSAAPGRTTRSRWNKLILDVTDEHMLFEPADAEMDDGDDDDGDDSLSALMKGGTASSGPTGPRKRRHLHLPTRALSAGEILRRREEKGKQLDKFNLSNDKWYSEVTWAQDQRTEGAVVAHSNYAYKLAYAKTNLFKHELLTFHRPRGAPLTAGAVFRLTAPRKRHQAGRKRASAHAGLAVIKSKRDLSAREGRIVLTEYTEEHPPLIMRVGMASAVRNYYRKKSEDDVPHLSFQDGEAVILEPKDESPFLGDVPKGKSLQSLENNLFKVPIFRHEVKETDFLLVRHGDKFVVREVASLYCVAQVQPLVTVPAPRSRTAEEYVKKRLAQYVYHMFRERKLAVDKAVAAAAAAGGPPLPPMALEATVKISDITAAFPDQSDNSIRKCLKRVADYKRGGDDNGSWYLKSESLLPPEDDLRAMVTLEEICAYESMLAAQQRLEEEGITKLIHITPSLLTAVAAIADNSPKKRAAKFIEEELQLTPWNLTANFTDAIRGRGLLQLTGLGDPSGRGEAFSFVRMPQKVLPKDAREREREREPREKVVVTGTDRDLRKLSLQDTARVLQEFGVPDEEINKLHRWRRIALIRNLANKAKEEGGDDDGMTKFARGSRFTVLSQQLSYNEKCQRIFDNMMKALGEANPALSDDEEDDEGDAEGERLNQQDLEGLDALERAMAMADEDGDAEGGVVAPAPPMPAAANTSASTEPQVVALETEDKHPTTYVRKIYRNPDGTVAREELIRDRATVERFLADPKYKKGRPNAKRPRMETEEEAARRQAIKREKRRIQEKNRRHRKNAEKQRELQKRFEQGENTTDNNKNLKLKCGRCGMIGHMKTNRICPFFKSDDEADDDQGATEQRQTRPRRAPSTKKRASRRSAASDEDGEDDDDDVPLANDEEEDEEEELALQLPSAKRRKTGGDSTTKRNAPVGKLCDVLLEVLRVVTVDPRFWDFKQAVRRSVAPDYYDVITTPMWLGKIREKIEQLQYTTVEAFVDDVKLIRDNCYAYNRDRNPHMLPLADDLFRIIQAEITKQSARINQALSDTSSSSARTGAARLSYDDGLGGVGADADDEDDGDADDGEDEDEDDDAHGVGGAGNGSSSSASHGLRYHHHGAGGDDGDIDIV